MTIDQFVAGVLLLVAAVVALRAWREHRESQLHRDIEFAHKHRCSVPAARAIRKAAR